MGAGKHSLVSKTVVIAALLAIAVACSCSPSWTPNVVQFVQKSSPVIVLELWNLAVDLIVLARDAVSSIQHANFSYFRGSSEDAMYPDANLWDELQDEVLEVDQITSRIPKRIVAIGDLHGDKAQAAKVLMLAGLVDSNLDWIGGNAVLVQTGDIVDRGPNSIELLLIFQKLQVPSSPPNTHPCCCLAKNIASSHTSPRSNFPQSSAAGGLNHRPQ